MIEVVFGWIFGAILVGMVLLLLYDALFRPWKFVERQVNDLEKQLELLNGRFARLHAFMIAPWLGGDVERTREFLRKMRSTKLREYTTYVLLRGDEE